MAIVYTWNRALAVSQNTIGARLAKYSVARDEAAPWHFSSAAAFAST
jgi:hypothetical protein